MRSGEWLGDVVLGFGKPSKHVSELGGSGEHLNKAICATEDIIFLQMGIVSPASCSDYETNICSF